MSICISCESTVDLPKELIQKFDLKVIYNTVLLKDKEYIDGEITCEEIVEFVAKNKMLAKTSAINTYRFEEHFKKLREEYDNVIHISLSSGLSCSCNNAVTASKNIDNVYVIDSKNMSTGIALLCVYCRKLVDSGLEVEEIVNKVRERVPFVTGSYVIEKLDYLYKGGRCNALQLLGANLLKLRPQILVTNGKLIPGKKYRGKMEECVKKYCLDVVDSFVNPDKEVAFLSYTTATEEMIEIGVNTLKENGFKNIYVTRAGATVSCHSGEHCLGLIYINNVVD